MTFTVTQYGTNYIHTPQIAEYPDYAGVYFPTGVVIDSSGNWIFTESYRVPDPNTGDLADHVQKYNPGTDHLTTLESGNFDAPGGLSMDSAGNLFIANTGDIGIQGAVSTIKLYTAATQATTTLVASGLHRATGTAVDRNGDVYIADSGSGSILKYTYATGAVTTLISGLSKPQGVALDGALNLYITDGVNNAVYKWTAATAQLSTLVTGLNNPYGVAVDGYGNLFIADIKNEAIKKWSVATGQTTILDSTYIPQYYEDRYPYGITVDASGKSYTR